MERGISDMLAERINAATLNNMVNIDSNVRSIMSSEESQTFERIFHKLSVARSLLASSKPVHVLFLEEYKETVTNFDEWKRVVVFAMHEHSKLLVSAAELSILDRIFYVMVRLEDMTSLNTFYGLYNTPPLVSLPFLEDIIQRYLVDEDDMDDFADEWEEFDDTGSDHEDPADSEVRMPTRKRTAVGFRMEARRPDQDEDEDEEEAPPAPAPAIARRAATNLTNLVVGEREPARVVPPSAKKQAMDEEESDDDEEGEIDLTRAPRLGSTKSLPDTIQAKIIPAVAPLSPTPSAPASTIVEEKND